ncbi:two-component system sensor histidine kinase NtrB [Halodesulfovibrio marinisediminis]|uniref:histidine kinase n=1 Tax=Halodesulfovibrio marinisediminis DSM 17456 TaxID=1121457 RepID=A0A1N6GP63_9BACT|nr:PAS domain-containing sensor histidine kinase [Halodesulfovibrio marinisediminis]SIO09281.1 PAS fold-containing protein [Halodesulfovibrio marinisediminis DSM 17456]
MESKQHFENDKGKVTTLNIATVGYRRMFRELLVHLFSELPEGMVKIKVRAIACAPQEELPDLICLDDVNFYDSVEELCENIDDVNIVLDLSEKSEYLEYVKLCAPAGVSVVGGDSLCVFKKTPLTLDLLEGKACSLERALGFFGTFVDQSEEEFWLLDSKGVVLDANKTVLNRQRDVDLEGEEGTLIHNVLPYTLQPDNVVVKAVDTGKRADQVITKVTSDGDLQYFGLSAYPAVASDGTIQSVILSRRDITENYSMVRKLQQTEKLAAIGEMSAFVAHEIRNPLFAIGGFARALLSQETLNETDTKKVKIIFNESQRLEKILKIILNFARPAVGEGDEIDVNEVISEALGLLRMRFESQGGIVTTDLDSNLAKVHGNPDQLKQCIINGIKNGFEAMPDGGTLRVETKLSADNWVIIRIMDSGEGIPDDIIEHLFNPFFTTKAGGTGLGLAMTKKIIEDMGGKVKIRSKLKKGTVLAFYLPPVSLGPPVVEKHDEKTVMEKPGSVSFLGGSNDFIRKT